MCVGYATLLLVIMCCISEREYNNEANLDPLRIYNPLLNQRIEDRFPTSEAPKRMRPGQEEGEGRGTIGG